MTVIQTYEEFFLIVPGLIMLFIGAVLTSIFAILLQYEANVCVKLKSAIMIIGIALVIVGVIMSVMSVTRYQIILDDETPLSTVQQRYEIVGQKGISYIVEEVGGE